MREIVCLAVIYKKRLMVVKNRGRWVLPGSRLKVGELKIDCLFDDVLKQVPDLVPKDLRFLGRFNGRNLLQWSPLRDKVYLAKAEKKFFDDYPGNDGRIKWIKDSDEIKLTKRTKKIFWILKSEGCL